ncbi:MAG: EamA family transporter [Paludibacterium sp.]|uniref:EamA family transporter n=1 Tax=Paludibacterium sp. TaxID=1917523 RepID=UPI0025CD20C1|nr:EamA family transporter [Paludibacterium sp.]MBV8049483.1 EamA family transporter [Paludibacterium sp.]MBV8646257.1 EamA family transporter [Paludibacterium sp.]
MSLSVFCLVLLAAASHASWNTIVKQGADKPLSTVLVATSVGLLGAVLLPFLPSPAQASWPYIAISVALQIVYFVLLARAYHLADMSQTYPLMRGAAPIVVALVGALWLGEVLPLPAWLGIGGIAAGILSLLAGTPKGADRRGFATALTNALVIAGYTLIDGMGVRLSGAPLAYAAWLFVLTGLPLLGWAAVTRGPALRDYAARHWRLGLIGGLGSLVSYGVVLWAMTQAPVALVAALRETSILFGALLSWRLLGERTGAKRVLSIGMIALGAVALRASR